jgi:hypothetical protein
MSSKMASRFNEPIEPMTLGNMRANSVLSPQQPATRSRRWQSGGNPVAVRGRVLGCVLLQHRKQDAGRVTRVSAIRREKLVVESIRTEAPPDTEPKGGLSDRRVIDHTSRAFIPPRTLAAIIDGTGPHDATVTALAQAAPYRWDHSPVQREPLIRSPSGS